MPALIDTLDDGRFSRSVRTEFSFHGQYRDSARIIRVGDLAWEILDKMSGGTLEATPHGGPPTSGQPTKRQIAERLWDMIADRFRSAREPEATSKETAGRRSRAGSPAGRR